MSDKTTHPRAYPSRVAYVVSLFPCWSETFIVREIQALLDIGVDVRILSLKRASEDLVQPEAARLADRVHYPARGLRAASAVIAEVLRSPGATIGAAASIVADGWRSPVTTLKSLAALWRGLSQAGWLRGFDPQMIHAHWATYPSTVAWALGRILGKPFGFTSHAHDIFTERQLLRRKVHDAALPVTISRYNVDWLNTEVCPSIGPRLKLVHCGVDMAHMPWEPDGRATDTILAVGRLDPIKGFDTLVRALALLDSEGVICRTRLVGSGPLEADLKSLARDLGIADRIEFAGARGQDTVRQWMRESALFVLPSQIAPDGNRDGIPVALMEAMASGCTVVSTRVSGIPELVAHEHNGIIVEPRDPRALAAQLRRLLEDPGLRRRLATRARAHVEEQFDARKEAMRLHAHMQEVLRAA